jgi:hypothetical protein
MSNKVALIAAASAALLGLSSNESHAGPTANFGWHVLGEDVIGNGACAAGGLVAKVGYYGELAPRVGHTVDAALVITVRNNGVDANGNPCGTFTAIPTFDYADSEIERDPTVAVMCEWVRKDGSIVALPTTSNSGCSNTPLPNPYNYTDVYGWSKLDSGEEMRVYLPVKWVRPASPTFFAAEVGSNLGRATPAVAFNIEPGPAFTGFSTANITASMTNVTFTVAHHPNDVGQVVIEYGTSTSYGMVTPVQNTSSATSQTMTFTLTGLQAGTQYHYRVRYLIPLLGVTWGADRTFGTDPATIIVAPQPAPTFPCRYWWCR